MSSSEYRLLAVNPDATWEIQKNGLDYYSLEDFQTYPTTKEIENLLKAQIQWAQKVDLYLNDYMPYFKENDFRPARYFLFPIKGIWDTYIQRASILDTIASRINPEKILFFDNNEKYKFDRNFAIQGSALVECIPEWSKYHSIVQTPLPTIPLDTFWKMQSDIGFTFRHSFRNALHLLPDCIYQKIFKIYWRTNISSSPNTPNLTKTQSKLILKKMYDVNEDLFNELQNNGISLLPFEDFIAKKPHINLKNIRIEKDLQDAWEDLISQDWFWYPGGSQKWSLQKILKPLFKFFWFNIIPDLWKNMTHSIEILDIQKPQALLYGVIPDVNVNEIGLIMALRSKNIPIFCYQHGSSMGDIENPLWDVTDRFYSDYMLVYGNGEQDYINSRPNHGDFNAIPLTVGSARLDTIAKKNRVNSLISLRQKCVGKNNNPVILYIPGIFFNNLYFYIYNMKNAPFFEVRNKIAQLFADNPQINFLYKSFVSIGTDPTIEMLKEVCPKCRIINNIPLSDLQWSADVLIHEVPSTGMYEGLLTDKPMIVYSDRDVYRLSSEAKEMLSRRVILTESVDAFVEKTKNFLEANDFAPLKNPDREFLKRYCTHLDDGKSAHRASDAIAAIVKNKVYQFK